MSLVGLNFNGGTGGGADTDSIVDASLWKRGEVDQAMSRPLQPWFFRDPSRDAHPH